jgi:hypothetical protein
VPETLARPIAQVRDGLSRRRAVQPPPYALGSDDPHHLDVDHMRRRLIDVFGCVLPTREHMRILRA